MLNRFYIPLIWAHFKVTLIVSVCHVPDQSILVSFSLLFISFLCNFVPLACKILINQFLIILLLLLFKITSEKVMHWVHKVIHRVLRFGSDLNLVHRKEIKPIKTHNTNYRPFCLFLFVREWYVYSHFEKRNLFGSKIAVSWMFSSEFYILYLLSHMYLWKNTKECHVFGCLLAQIL